MTNASIYEKKEITRKGMKVYLEFPEPTENDNEIKKEVKELLTYALHEYMKRSVGNNAEKKSPHSS